MDTLAALNLGQIGLRRFADVKEAKHQNGSCAADEMAHI